VQAVKSVQSRKDQLNDHLSPKQKAEVAGVLVDLEAAGLVSKLTVAKGGPGRPATVWELVK
jgi:predicted ArsR family transcriptional regulator